ncbi:unnamed protein product [Gulo gulo]|uniref:Uncharacterized protein n=1 Tax=Gulo gulo TaxID=48420 RepID=A0A9X9PVM5_GULGU|nr:unnamed protein product [Gulo gulo]
MARTRGPPQPSPHPRASLGPQDATYFPASRPRRPGGTWSRRGRRWPRCPPHHSGARRTRPGTGQPGVSRALAGATHPKFSLVPPTDGQKGARFRQIF